MSDTNKMTKEQKELLRSQLHELLDLVLDTNGLEERTQEKNGPLPAVFFEYSGHVNLLELSIYPDGWKRDGYEEPILESFLKKPIPNEKMEYVKSYCKNLLATKRKETEIC